MSDRGPYGSDPDPTEAFPPLPSDPAPTPPSDLPPIGSERDPDPTRVMPPTQGDVPTTAMPSTGGYDPGPPFVPPPGGGGGGGGGDEPPFEPEPDPWYRQPGPLAALIAGIAAVIVAIIAIIVWTGDDDDGELSGQTLPSVARRARRPPRPRRRRRRRRPIPPTTTSAPTTTSTSTTTTTTHHDHHDHDDDRPGDDDHAGADDDRPRRRRRAAATSWPGPPRRDPGEPGSRRRSPTPLVCTGLDDDVLAGAARHRARARRNDVFADAGWTRAPTRTPPSRSCCCTSSSVDLTSRRSSAPTSCRRSAVDRRQPHQPEIGADAAQITDSVQAGRRLGPRLDAIISP